VPATRNKIGSILARFGEDGLVDRAFGHLGIEGVLTEHLEAIDIPENGKIVAAGSFSSGLDIPILVRFEGGEWDGVEPCVEDCGNGDVEILEECDDGNVTSGDGCSVACLVE
jgi:cysteine-rich repeat protein